MAISKSSNRKPTIQFIYYSPSLPSRLSEDVAKSPFSTRPKYLNALLEKILSFKKSSARHSSIEELFELIKLFDSLPIERIRRLAPTQNRSFAQMVKHLIELALSLYPEGAQAPVSDRDFGSQAQFRERRKLAHPKISDFSTREVS